MTRATLPLFLLAGTTTAAFIPGLDAQTTATHRSTAVHHTATTARRAAPASGCVKLPEFSTKIPALPAGSPCPKSMITVSEKIELSPLVGPAVREGFSNLDSSFTLAYVDEVMGTGAPAQPRMYYTVRYTGYLPDGTKFDSSADHPGAKPLSFPYGAHRVIPGWDLGFEGMRLGGKRRLYIPWQLAYGERGRPPIPPKSELIFDMELVSQSPTDPDAPPPTPPTPPAGPGSPSASPILGNPPTVSPAPGSTPPAPSARPQTGPDTKPAPSPDGAPQPGTTTPPTPKQPPQGER